MSRILAVLLLVAAVAGGEAIRLVSADAELAVDPGTARLIRFGPLGGRNLVWVHPSPTAGRPTKGGWINYGGDKLWIWPQERWAELAGKSWPPPMDVPAMPWSASVADGVVTATSPPLPGFGVRLVRTFALAAIGVGCTVTDRCQVVSGATVPTGLGYWDVAQIPLPRDLRVDGLGGEGVWVFSGEAWRWRRDGTGYCLDRSASVRGKVGFDADALIAVDGEGVLTLRARPVAGVACPPGERAQVYSEPDASPDLPPGCPSYLELEFTAPLHPDRPLIVDWSWAPASGR